MRFSSEDKNSGEAVSIYLPIPPGVTFSDSGNYSTMNLGVLGAGGSEALSGALSGDLNKIKGGLSKAGASVESADKGEIAAILTKVMGSDAIGDINFLERKQLIAPNTNTTFEGNSVRSYTFQMKLVARTEEESNSIYLIHSSFRRLSYADSAENKQNLILNYPSTWKIQFYDFDGNLNSYYPAIFDCYLTTVQTTFNASGNALLRNGAPVETDLAITFQETRALTRADIRKLG